MINDMNFSTKTLIFTLTYAKLCVNYIHIYFKLLMEISDFTTLWRINSIQKAKSSTDPIENMEYFCIDVYVYNVCVRWRGYFDGRLCLN